MVDELAAKGEGIAEIGPDFIRRIGEESGIRNRPDPAAAELAEDDLLVGEVDKDGNGSRTFIAKGDPIPPELAQLPRAPARAPSRKR